MTTLEAATPDPSLMKSWRIQGAALGLLVLLILVQFRQAVADAVQVWWIYPTYSHCFLIVPISLWLIWEKRDQLAYVQPRVDGRALLAVPVLLFLWWIGQISTIHELQQFAVVGLVQVAIVAMLGTQVYRKIWFPALYLFFLVPTGEYLIAPMQRFATLFADIGLSILQIPHYTHGTLIDLSNGSFEIAEACAGLRFLIATVVLGILFAYITFRKWYKIALFLLGCVVVPLIGNGLRVIGIILLAHFTNNEYGAGADHLVYGWGFNVAILLVVFWLGSRFADHIDDRVDESPTTQMPNALAKTFVVFLSAAILVSLGPAFASWHDLQRQPSALSNLNKPMQLQGWRAEKTTDNWQPAYSQMDAKLVLSLTPSESLATSPVDLYVAYYARARTIEALASKLNHPWNNDTWRLLTSGNATAHLDGRNIQMQEWIVTSPAGRRLIWTFYWVNGHFASSSRAVKLLLIPAALEGHEGQALVSISTAINSSNDDARRRLSSALTALKDLPARLNAANLGHSDTAPSN